PSDTQPREPTRIGRDAPLEPRDELSAYAPPATPPPVWALVALGVVPPLSWLLTLIPVMAGRLRPGQSGSRRKKYRLDFRRINELAKQGDLHQTARELEQEGYALLEARLSLKGRGILRAH